MYKIIFMTQAQKDAKKLASSGLKPKVLQLIKIIEEDRCFMEVRMRSLVCGSKGAIVVCG